MGASWHASGGGMSNYMWAQFMFLRTRSFHLDGPLKDVCTQLGASQPVFECVQGRLGGHVLAAPSAHPKHMGVRQGHAEMNPPTP